MTTRTSSTKPSQAPTPCSGWCRRTRTPRVSSASIWTSRQPACAAFKAHGVSRVVGVSALGRGSAVVGNAGLVTASLAMDAQIAASGVAYRALTMPSFMDNMLRQVEPIRTKGMFFSPLSGDRKLPTCATRDIAAVAAKLLLDRSWSGVDSVPVLGPEDLSQNDMAAIMSEVLGKPVRFQQISGEAHKAGLIQRGWSEAMAQGVLDMAVPRTRGSTMPSRARPRTPRRPAFGSGAKRC